MDGKPAIETDDADLGPFANADPAWLRAQILPAIEESESDPSSLKEMEDVFRELKAELLARMS